MNKKKIDETGKIYGELFVIEEYGRDSQGVITWLCICSCGKKKIVRGTHLRRGLVQSCRCLQKRLVGLMAKKVNVTHSMSYHPIYNSWDCMWQRCTNPNAKGYKNYGGRGIKVCKRWKKAKNFIDDMLPNWKKGLTIDRINNDGHYTPSNCRWATFKQQRNNQRSLKK